MRRSAAGLSRKSVLCCGVKAKIAGYGVLHYHFFGCGFIELLMVEPALRGQGVGSALLLRQRFVLSGQVDNLDDGDPELFYFRRLSCRND